MTTVIVGSVIANKPHNGGNAWAVLNWVLGLERLGFDVYFVEQISRECCVDATGAIAPFESCVNRAYFDRVVEEFGLGGKAALIYDEGERIHGLAAGELFDVTADAALLVNITGHLRLPAVLSRVRRKAYVDFDPGFTQFWQALGSPGANLEGHDDYFTIGENIGHPDCSIPTGDIPWRPIRQPIVLERCPIATDGARDRFTTVGAWRGPYGPVEYGGRTYGLKVHEFRKFVELPLLVPQELEAALSIDPADAQDRDLLAGHGWRLVDPRVVASDPASYHAYVQASGAEFSAAQGIYVDTASGWISDRTIRYLASGKPALVQDTGFSRSYPVGEGLVPFRTLDEAVAGAKAIERDYDHHARAARRLAETYFDSDQVLGEFVDAVAVAP